MQAFKSILFIVILMVMITIPIVDAYNVNVTPQTTPYITLNHVGNHTIGEVFLINGTTNLAPSGKPTIQLVIYALGYRSSRCFRDCGNDLYGEGYVRNIAISEGINGTNQWSENITDLDWRSNNLYDIGVYSTTVGASEGFWIVPSNSINVPPVALTTASQSNTITVSNQATNPIPTTIKSSGFDVLITMVGVVISCIAGKMLR
jgi:hypothetical protein